MRWFMKNNREAFQTLRRETTQSPLSALLLANRGIGPEEAEAFLHPRKEDLLDPFLFQEMEIAVTYIYESLQTDTPIRIIGDYDQDGVAASTILVKGLRALAEGMGKNPMQAVSYAIPDRIEDGYGLNASLVEQAAKEGIGLIITVDNGVAAFEGLEKAYEYQIPVIVTDHHEAVTVDGQVKRPPCEALLNPKFPEETYPFPGLCGAGVAFKVMQALCRYGDMPMPFFDELIGFAALGTICDMMDLQGENRVIVSLGLEALSRTENPGLRALLKLHSWDRPVTTYTAGFIIGPCINSSGRLSTARLGVELFLEQDEATVEAYAQELYTLNEERKDLTKQGVEEAFARLDGKVLPSVIAEVLPDVHESVCGLIAGRVKDRYHRPTLIFTKAMAGEHLLKGSGRSIEAYDMFTSLNLHRDRYVAFGGHRMACGMTVREEDFQALRALWNAEANLQEKDFEPSVDFDGVLDLSSVHADALDAMEALAPYGKGNPSPLFAATHCNVLSMRLVGRQKNVLQILLESKGARLQGVAFSGDTLLQKLVQEGGSAAEAEIRSALYGQPSALTVDILYRPEWNEFQGKKKIQLKLADIRMSKV